MNERFFAVILAKKGYTVTEVEVEARPRSNGRSKYGAERFLRGAMDFLTVFFLSGYVDRPLHLLGGADSDTKCNARPPDDG